LRFCVSVYLNIVKAFRAPAVSQVEIGNKLLEAATGETFMRYDDGQISDLFHGKKNVGESVIYAARNIDERAYLGRFEELVLPLVNANELSTVVAAVRNAIAGDDCINPQTVIDPISETTKFQISRCASFSSVGFLAKAFLYALLNVENKGTRADAKAVDTAFIEEAERASRSISLVSSEEVSMAESRLLWRSGPNSVSVAAGDIFNKGIFDSYSPRALAVVPVDTSFSVSLANGLEVGDPFLVSPNSIHGKFLRAVYATSCMEDELRRRIDDSLDRAGLHRDSRGRCPLGSIAVIDDGCVSYCLLAIAEHDFYGNTQSAKADIEKAIDSLVLFYDRRGFGYPLLIPLVGTGRSRSGMSYQESFELILSVLMRNKKHIQGDVIVVAMPNAFKELDLKKAAVDCAL
jgi:hypothetical protein